MGGLAWAIAAASLCLLVAPALIGGALGYFVLRKRAGWLGAVLGALGGVVLGGLGVAATFYESSWSPPSTLIIDAPGLRHSQVIFVEDAAAANDVVWTGFSMPFTARAGRVTVPASGVIRVRTTAWIYGREVRASLTTGQTETGLSVLEAPGVGHLVVLDFAPYPAAVPDISSLTPAELARMVTEREAER